MKGFFYAFSVLYLVLYSSIPVAYSQNQLAIGDWQVLLPFKSGRLITHSSEKVYYATAVALMSIDKTTLERRKVTKIDGLNDVNISGLSYDQSTDKLILGYENTKLDLLYDNKIVGINDLFEKSILGDKTIYDIYTKDGIAYISSGVGLIEFNLRSELFGFFTSTNFRINNTWTINNILYAGTENGLYSFDLDSPSNPADINSWSFLGTEVGLEPIYEVTDIISIGDQLFVSTYDKVFSLDNGSGMFTQIVEVESMTKVKFLFEYNDSLSLGLESTDSSVTLHTVDSEQLTPALGSDCTNVSNDAYQDENGRLWIADEFNDFRYLEDGVCKRISPEGPRSVRMSDLEFYNDTLYVASGGAADNYTYSFSALGFYQYSNDGWRNYDQYNTKIIADSNLINIYTLAKNPFTHNLNVGTYWNGILDFNLIEKTGTVANQYTDSSLSGAIGDDARTRITEMVYDVEGNLWISNFGASQPLSVYTREGTWHSFSTGNFRSLTDIVIDDLGYKWIGIAGNNGGVLVYDDGGTIADPTDDRFFEINQSNSILESGIIHSLVKDNDGDIWVGSELGPVIFRCGNNIFDGDCFGNVRKVEQDGELAVLLATESIRTMSVDGGNQKWFGTTNGVFVQSADGLTRKHTYTTDNSPLLDNTIIDFAYDEKSGLMYIATNNGLNAIKTESTGAKFSHSGKATVFPNPVRPDYVGPIAINGLANNANIKITDVNGNLVYETQAIGGQAIWDGQDYNAVRASSGIYLVFSSTTDASRDPDSFVTKILLVK